MEEFQKKGREVFQRKCGKKSLLHSVKKQKKPYGKGLTCPQFQLEYDSTWGFPSFLSHTGVTMGFFDFSYVRVRSDFCVLFFLVFLEVPGMLQGRQCSGSATVCLCKD